MASFNELVEIQKTIAEELKKLITNYKKDSATRKTLDYLQKKAVRLDELWDQFEKNDNRISTNFADQLDHQYFTKAFYESVRAGYEEARDDIAKRIEATQTGIGTSVIPASRGSSVSDLGEGQKTVTKGQSGASDQSSTTRRGASDTATTTTAIGKLSYDAKGASPKNQGCSNVQPEAQNLIIKQNTILNVLRRIMTNMPSLDLPQSEQFYQLKIGTLQRYLQEAQDLHQDIWESLSDVTLSNYNVEEFFAVEELTQNIIIELHQARSLNSQPQQASAAQAPVNLTPQGNSMAMMKLPKIVLPRFEGDYLKWRQFCDLFTELVHNQHIANCQKMWYLKTSLSGEAEKLIRHLTVSDANYTAAWKLIKERYENSRLLTTAFLNKLLSQPSAAYESAISIKNLHDTTQECLFGLQNLGVDTSNWDPLVTHILLKKLDRATYTLYEQSLEQPRLLQPLKDLMSFLEVRFQSLEACGNKARSLEESNKRAQYMKSATSMIVTEPNCTLCKDAHQLFVCPKFLQLAATKRLEHVKRSNLCVNCLKKGHGVQTCPSRACKKCSKRHNSLLHIDREPSSSKSTVKQRESPLATDQSFKVPSTIPERATSLTARKIGGKEKYILLGTAVVRLIGQHGRHIDCRAILDSGSQLNLISKKVANELGLPERNEDIAIEGIGDQKQSAKRRVNIVLQSRTTNFSVRLEAHVLPRIVSQQPARQFSIDSWPIPKNLSLADPNFNKPTDIDILIGAELYFSLLSVGQIPLGDDYPILQNTVFGWIVSGKINNQPQETMLCGVLSQDEALDTQLERFWQLEEKEVSRCTLTAEEKRCETFFNQTTKRDKDGRFIIQLPFIGTPSSLGDSSSIAYQRLVSLERKLAKNDDLRTRYIEFMKEYIRLGHMEEVDLNKIEKPYFFLPHHCVIKPESTTTKLRVVFDGSATTSTNRSLNDILSKGPTIQDDVFSILLRFRMPRYVYTADIEKMYRQIWMNKNDRKYQLLWWREDPAHKARCYQLCTVTYGTTSAPYLAIRCLQTLAQEHSEQYPLGAQAIKRGFYVDDVLTGADSVADAIESQRQLKTILATAGFKLRKWCANHPHLLEGIAVEDKELELNFKTTTEEHIKTIGLSWLPVTDEFCIKSSRKDNRRITKRTALSDIAQLFDPLGIMAPVVVTAKLFLQQLWTLKLDWDAALPQELHTFWKDFRDKLLLLNNVKFPRHVLANKVARTIQLHIFADASEWAYGAAAYVRALNTDNTITVRLLCAKSRVAPTKKTTLPRLELCAAAVAAELAQRIRTDLSLQTEQLYLWSDSQIVLAWIRSPTSTFHTFVANRVSRIQELTIPSQWRHIGSTHNPADLLSRGMAPEQLSQSVLWFYGPLLLHGSESLWPSPSTSLEIDYTAERREAYATASLITSEPIFQNINHHNSFRKLLRIIAYVLRFSKRKRPEKHLSVVISASELNLAKEVIIKQMQNEGFKNDINHIKRYGEVAKNSNLSILCPFIDQQGLLRVGGRLQASNLEPSAKHQLLLPYDHSYTKMLMNDIHKENHHIGPQALLAVTRQQYWPIKGKTLARSIVDHCVRCTRAKPKLLTQMMGSLPPERVQPARPFINCGVDFCGPVWTHFKIRGKRPQKSYIAVFCCFSTKAVHLELVTDLTTQGFIGALRRFMARRGHCRTIFCDNATNFVGAKTQLDEIRRMIEDEQSRTDIESISSTKGVEFKFIPPRAPHFGGLWEAAVKSAKHLLQRTIASAELTYEELETVVVEIEAILNSRPITPMSSNPNDLTALTPGHFLIGDTLINPIDPRATSEKVSLLKRWKLVSHIKNEFWRRWSCEYLNQLQCRYKWKQTGQNIKTGTLVILKEDNLPPLKWPLGRIVEVFKGNDGFVRVVDVRTRNGILRRPIHKLAPLPVESGDHILEPVETSSKLNNTKSMSENTLDPVAISTHNQQEAHKPPKKKQKLSFGTVVTTVLLTCLVLPFSQCNADSVTIRPFESQPGLYFENLGTTNIVTNEWNIVAFYNMTPFWNEFTALVTCVDLLKTICQQMNSQHSCKPILDNVQHIIAEITENNNLLRPVHTPARIKRGALNIVGNVASALFGVLDEEYAKKMAAIIDTIQANELHLVKLIANQTSIIDSTNNIIRRDQEAVTNQIKEWNAHINRLTSEVNTIKKELHEEHLANTFTAMVMQAFITISRFQRIQSSILDVLIDTHHEKLNPQLITPDQLRQELAKIRNNLPPLLRLPTSQDDVVNYYNLITIQGRPTHGHIIFKLSLPLIAIEDFELLKPIPVPVSYNNSFIMIQPSSAFLLVDLHRDQYCQLPDLQACIIITGDRYLCRQTQPIYNKKSNISSCEIELLNHQPHPSSCKVTHDVTHVGKGPHWIALHNPNNWVYATAETTTINAVCNDKVEQLNLKGSGLLQLQGDCIIKQSFLTIRSHNRVQTSAALSYLPSPNLIESIVLNETPKIPLINQTYQPQSAELDSLKQQLQQLKYEEPIITQPHEIHQFTVGYVALFLGLLIIGWVLKNQCQQRHQSSLLQKISTKPTPAPRQTKKEENDDSSFQIDFNE